MNNSSKANSPQDPFFHLKEILLSEDKRKISKLEKELKYLQTLIDDKEKLIMAIEPVICELIDLKIINSKTEMAEVLAPIMSAAIKNQIEYAKEDVVDALYPIIGKTVRKSIAEAMKKLAQRVNEKVEKALSFRFIFKRLKARIAKVSQGDLILKEAIPFNIHEIFLIHKKTGILLAHASAQSDSSNIDIDLISGMLTAIRDFAKTLFTQERARDLDEIQYEDMRIRLEVGRHCYLAFVTSGLAPDSFSKGASHLENTISKKFLALLREFDGEIAPFKPVELSLKRFIKKYQTEEKAETKEIPNKSLLWRSLVLIFILIFVIVGAYFGIFVIPKKLPERKITTALNLLQTKDNLWKETNIQFSVDGRAVILTGKVDHEDEKEKIEALVASQPEVKNVINQIEVKPWPENIDQLIEMVMNLLGTEGSLDLSKISFVIEDNLLFLEGILASEEEKSLLRNTIGYLTNRPIIVDNLMVIKEAFPEEQKLLEEIKWATLYFETNRINLIPEELELFDEIAQKLKLLEFDTLYIIGHADETGPEGFNDFLSRERAEKVKSLLIQKGFDGEQLITMGRGSREPMVFEGTERERASSRRVNLFFQPTTQEK